MIVAVPRLQWTRSVLSVVGRRQATGAVSLTWLSFDDESGIIVVISQSRVIFFITAGNPNTDPQYSTLLPSFLLGDWP